LAGAREIVAALTGPSSIASASALELTSTNLDVSWSLTLIVAMTAGQTITPELQSLLAGDVYNVRGNAAMSVLFTPTFFAL